MTDFLCRTWKAVQYRLIITSKSDGKVIFDQASSSQTDIMRNAIITLGDGSELAHDLSYDDWWNTQFSFFPSGDYIMFFSGTDHEWSIWEWQDESKGIIIDRDDQYPEESSTFTVSKQGNQLLITGAPDSYYSGVIVQSSELLDEVK